VGIADEQIYPTGNGTIKKIKEKSMRKRNAGMLLLMLLITLTGFSEKQHTSFYEKTKQEVMKGWNTWDTHSALTHAYLPDGYAIRMGFIQRATKDEQALQLVQPNNSYFDKDIVNVRPGYHSGDGKYTCIYVQYHEVDVKIETAAEEDKLYVRIVPLTIPSYGADVTISQGILWNKSGTLSRKENQMEAEFPSGKKFKVFTPSEIKPDYYNNLLSHNFVLTIHDTIYFAVNHNAPSTYISDKIDASAKNYRAGAESEYGDLAPAVLAMEAGLHWNLIYDGKNDRVFSTVSRTWNVARGGYVFFGWDNFFISAMYGVRNKELAYLNAIEALKEITEEGFISNMSQANGRKAFDRSQPPVGALACKMIFDKYQEIDFIREVFPNLFRWNRWWLTRRLNGNLLSWGSHASKNPFRDVVHNNQAAAMLESGIDDSPMYTDASFNPEKHYLELWDVCLNSLYINDCKILAEFALLLGDAEKAEELNATANDFARNLELLWDDNSKIYKNYHTDKHRFSQKLSPTLFYPLISKTVSPERVTAMIDNHFFNTETFYGPYIMPSISRNDPEFEKQRYWKGAIWAPMNFLVYMGLINYPEAAAARKDLAQKSLDMFMKNYDELGLISENYSAITGRGDDPRLESHPFYNWGALLALIGIIENEKY
jgi:putative isomerase